MANNRIPSIDVLRSITMFLMIFVNDLWSLSGVPKWLEHTLADEDGIGFSDTIFPLFLFIVGMSIPLAINARRQKSSNNLDLLKHIGMRTIALLVMGVFMVNYGSIYNEGLPFDKNFWQILMASAICLIWIDYGKLKTMSNTVIFSMKGLGVLTLIYLAYIYQGGNAENITWMQPRWWGILGLIGWAYLVNAIIYIYLGKRILYLTITFGILIFMNIQEKGYFDAIPSPTLIISASNYALVMAGMICTSTYLHYLKGEKPTINFWGLMAFSSLVMVILGCILRIEFPISKIYATPSWTTICIGISIFSFVIIHSLGQKVGFSWANIIQAAGTSTLTCYLMPYFIYPIFTLVGWRWPESISYGVLGIIKSLLFSLVIILFVRALEKRNIKLTI